MRALHFPSDGDLRGREQIGGRQCLPSPEQPQVRLVHRAQTVSAIGLPRSR